MSHGRLRQRPWGKTSLLTVEAPPPWEWCSARFTPEADVLERWQICLNSPQNWCFYRNRNFQRLHHEDDTKTVLSTKPVVVPAEAVVQDLRLSSVHEEIAEKSFSMAKLMVHVSEMPAELPDNQTTKAQFSHWCISVEWLIKPGSLQAFCTWCPQKWAMNDYIPRFLVSDVFRQRLINKDVWHSFSSCW